MESNSRESSGRVLTKAIIERKINISDLHFAYVTELEVLQCFIWYLEDVK